MILEDRVEFKLHLSMGKIIGTLFLIRFYMYKKYQVVVAGLGFYTILKTVATCVFNSLLLFQKLGASCVLIFQSVCLESRGALGLPAGSFPAGLHLQEGGRSAAQAAHWEVASSSGKASPTVSQGADGRRIPPAPWAMQSVGWSPTGDILPVP